MAEAFAHAAEAMTGAITDPKSVDPATAVSVGCAAPDGELLLVDWLNALIYEMATRHMLFCRFDVAIDGTKLEATAWGEMIDIEKHQPAVEVKGATNTHLHVQQRPNGRWVAECVVDV